jgi:hypothetical protein
LSVEEKHYTVPQLASSWQMSADTIRRLFRDEPGVLRLNRPAVDWPKKERKRGYATIIIPESTAKRVYDKLLKSRAA